MLFRQLRCHFDGRCPVLMESLKVFSRSQPIRSDDILLPKAVAAILEETRRTWSDADLSVLVLNV